MTGVQYVKNEAGETTHLLIDWKLHRRSLERFLADLQDIEAAKKTDGDELISLKAVRQELIDRGVSEDLLEDV